jgi:hypothetical protein
MLTNDWMADSSIMYSLLSELTLVSGNERSGKKFFCRQNGAKGKAQSCLFGFTWRRNMGTTIREFDFDKKLFKTKLMADNPELLVLFKEFSSNYFPDFEWSQVQINYMPSGCAAKQHLDSKNTGESVLVAFGDYRGGNTYVQNENDRNYTIYDARIQPIKFNGSALRHGVTTVTSGDRYSLVFFNNCKKK